MMVVREKGDSDTTVVGNAKCPDQARVAVDKAGKAFRATIGRKERSDWLLDNRSCVNNSPSTTATLGQWSNGYC